MVDRDKLLARLSRRAALRAGTAAGTAALFAATSEATDAQVYPPPNSPFVDEIVGGIRDLPRDAGRVRHLLLDSLADELGLGPGGTPAEGRFRNHIAAIRRRQAELGGDRFQEQLLTAALARMIELKAGQVRAMGMPVESMTPVRVQFLVRQYLTRDRRPSAEPPAGIITLRIGRDFLSGRTYGIPPSPVPPEEPPDVIVTLA